MGIDILGIDIMGVDILGIDIPAPTPCWDGANASWVLPVLFGSKCALLKATTGFDPSEARIPDLSIRSPRN